MRKKSSNPHDAKARPGTTVVWSLPLGVAGGVAIIVITALLAYYPSLNGEFILDDDLLLIENPLITASDGLSRFWRTTESPEYYPVTYSIFWFEWRVWGMNPTGYHAVNLVLHVIESLLIWIILRKMCIHGAFLAAVIFAVHPVNVESVAWVAQRRNMLAMLFFLLSILCYLKFLTRARVPLAAKRTLPTAHRPLSTFSSFILHPSFFSLWYWLSLAAFVLAMLSKGSAAVLPVVLLGIVWWRRSSEIEGDSPIFSTRKLGQSPWREGDSPIFSTRKLGQSPWLDLALLAPFFAVSGVLTVVNVWFQTHGVETVTRNASFIERLLGAGGVVWFYIYKALFPIDLSFVYTQWSVEPGNLLWWLPLSAVLIVTVTLWMYRKSWSRPFLFAWGFFCVSIVPVMGFTDVGYMRYSLVADHYQHIAIIGVIAMAAAGFSIWHQLPRVEARRAAIAVSIAAVVALAFLTWRQNGLYHDRLSLYQATLEKNPESWLAHNNLGLALHDAGRTREAIEHYQQAMRLHPEDSEVHNNLGNSLLKIGLPAEAIEQYQQALRLRPNYPKAYYNLGNALRAVGQFQQALEQYGQALRLNLENADLFNNMGVTLIQTNRAAEAVDFFRQALRIKPDYAEAYSNLGGALVYLGKSQEAIEYYQQALRLKPDNTETHRNMGLALVQLGRPREAVEHYMESLRLKPDFPMGYYNLAIAYAGMNQSSEAVAAARKGLELARSQGQTAWIKQIEDWLKSYQGQGDK